MLKSFLFELATLFAIINPYGLAFVFLHRTMGLSDRERSGVAKQVAIYAFCVLIVSSLAGTLILGFFGISIPALRIAGGLVVGAAGWNLLNEAPLNDEAHASSSQSADAIRAQAFFPLTVPLTTGPGTIATAITLAASRDLSHGWNQGWIIPLLSTLTASFIVAVAIFHAYAHVSRMARILGPEGTSVIMRLSAFLLLCVGVQIIINGVTGITIPGLQPPAR
ncbi:UPF0056 inner membrane protein [Alsobacter metallidurans]|uniref:UPF0056 membrane protein n=1 Tax=Alsobacter metallidurans TaxID=340221 RepID=A0A917I5F4_9HYPH|nr:MarC family protein [Alsobacter metallidurans]GGH11203.1 UPF0056 inner membrane protein [Alsobacter metallidurans]